MKIRKSVLWLLCAALLTPCFVSCAEETPAQDSAAPDAASEAAEEAPEEEVPPLDLLPAKDFGGAVFHILTNDRSDDYSSVEFAAEEINGSLINDAVYNRNDAIENRYNVDLSATRHTGEAQVLRNSVTSGDGSCDLALIGLTDAGSLALEHQLADLRGLPYVDFTAPWWDHNAADGLSLGGKLYMTLGDMNINDKDMTWCLFFDKGLAENYHLPDLYAMANEKKWTFDAFASLIEGVSADLNGDGAYDDNDLWGHVTVYARSTIAYIYSMGLSFIEKDADDLPFANLGQEAVYDAYTEIMDLFHNGNKCHDVETMPCAGYPHQWRKCEAMFGAQQILFYAEAMQNAERFRTFENDFGILPLPSAEEGQLGRHMVWREAYATVAPITTFGTPEQQEMVGLLLESIQTESHSTVLPAYYDKALKSKFSRDESSSEMIDIIFATRYYDIATYYGWGELSNNLMSFGREGRDNLASLLEKFQKKTDKAIAATIEELNK